MHRALPPGAAAKVKTKGVRSDGYCHVAMIVYHLHEVERIAHIPTMDLIEKAGCHLKWVSKKDGWQRPLLYLAAHYAELRPSEEEFKEYIATELSNHNFRVRGIAGWALARHFQGEN